MTGPEKNRHPQLLRDSTRHLADIHQFLQAAEQGRVTLKGLKGVHKTAHTLRDMAARADLKTVTRIARLLEDTLERQLARKRAPSKVKVALMDQVLLALEEQITRIRSGTKENPQAAEDIEKAFARLRKSASAVTPLPAPESGKDPAENQMTGAPGDVSPQAAGVSPEEPESAPENICCRFQVDRWDFHLPMKDMVEIAQLPEVIPLPFAPDYVRGLINLRGRVIPVIDLSCVRGTPPVHLAGCQLVIAQTREEHLAFLADRMPHLAPEYGGEALDVDRFVRQYGVKENRCPT